MNALIIKLVLVALAIAGIAGTYTWWRNSEREIGRAEIRAQWKAKDLLDANLRASDSRQQRQFNDLASGKHAALVDTISNQLGDARVQISKLSGRACLDRTTVRVLNAIGTTTSGEPGGAASGQSAGASEAFATDRDVGEALAVCRARYGEVSDQVNKILDIEDRRHPPAVHTSTP